MLTYGTACDLAKTLENRYDMTKFAIPCKISFLAGPDIWGSSHTDSTIRMRVSIRVPHRDTGESAKIAQVTDLNLEKFHSLDEIDFHVRQILHRLILHEVDECFMVDGERKFDPHANDPSAAVA